MTTKAKHDKGTAATTVSALSTPFSTGGGGVDFEHRVQATFLLALLVEGFSPLLNLPITSVLFQGKRSGHDIDDVVIISSCDEYTAKLLCQIKHGITLTENNTFKEVLVSAWSDFNKPDFNRRTDKIVLVSGKVANANSLRFIYDQANAAPDDKDFLDRIERASYSNGTNREKLNIIKKYLKEANVNQDVSDKQLWEFCKVFTILVFDLDYESSVNEFLIHALISSNCNEDAIAIWSQLVDYAARYDKAAAYVALSNIPEHITQKFKNIIASPNNTPELLNYDIDSFWAKLALIGSWNEKNDFDKKFVELFLERSYSEIQKVIQENSLQPNPNVSFSQGLWHVNHRRAIIKVCSKLYFDNDIKKFFEISREVLKEKDKRIQDNGDFSLLIPEAGPFAYSEALRNGIIQGLAMICNLSGTQSSCSAETINHEAMMLIRNLLAEASVSTWMSLDSYLPTIAEINPTEFLSCLEAQVVNTPKNIESLFPKNSDNLLFSRNFICSILWSLEGLAWDEKYFVKCIRILGHISKLNFEKTNSSNTPMNSIISIMLPWHIQTFATKEKQKNAIKALQQECPNVAWRVIKGLLPHATRSTGGTHQPRYIILNLPKEIRMSDEDILSLYQYYSRLALGLAKADYSKMVDLLSYYDDMDRDTIVEYLSLIAEQAMGWDDSKKYPFWKELLNQKEWLVHNTEDDLDVFMMKLLETTIEIVTPSDIRYIYRRLYEPGFFDYDDEGEFHAKWEAKRNKQETAVCEIYVSYGIESVVEFAKELNNEAWIAHNLGKQLKEDDIKTLLKMCYESKLNKDFFASIINGYIMANDYDAIIQTELEIYSLDYISWVLSCLRPSMRLFEIVKDLLGEQSKLYWDSISIPRFGLDDDIDLNYVWNQLVEQKRYAAAINLFGITSEKCSISHDKLQEVLTQAAITASNDRLDPDAVRNLIELLQRTRSISIEAISDVELIYLFWLDEHSKVKPLALRYRLANEPMFFCELIRLLYKKRHSETHEEDISEHMANRLWKILHNFCVVPGTDWDGNYSENDFDEWIAICKAWAKAEDREAIVQQTIGNGLSYARILENGLVDDFIMRELNKIENEEMRVGYRVGVFNQRGVRWIDPEGKPEFQLAEKYKGLAENAESMGYAKYAEMLRLISDDYTREAERNIRNHQLELEAHKREDDE